MSPIVRVAHFMGMSFFAIIMLLCAAWCAAFIYLFVVYGPFEAIVLATGSIMLLAIIYGMKRHGHHRYDHECDHR